MFAGFAAVFILLAINLLLPTGSLPKFSTVWSGIYFINNLIILPFLIPRQLLDSR